MPGATLPKSQATEHKEDFGMRLRGSALFRPLTINKLSLSGRLFKSATSETRANPDGTVGDEYLAFYDPIARAGTPLIVTGNMYVSRDGQSTSSMAGVDADSKIPGLQRLTKMVHGQGSRIFAQINHCGRQVVPTAVGLSEAVAPSPVTELFIGTHPRTLSIKEIKTLVERFAQAAERCQRAGFDGVQLHAAHGYLINEFLTPYTNRRNDEYGGSFDNRLRFLIEIQRAVRIRVGPDYPVILKLNGSDYLPLRAGLDQSSLVRIALRMQEEGADAVEISVGHYESGMPVVRGTFTRFFRGMLASGTVDQLSWLRRFGFRFGWPLLALLFNLIWPRREGFNLAYARKFKSALSIPVICVGGFIHRKPMQAAIDNEWCDAVSSGRAFIADPYLYQHLQEDVSGPQCRFCNACVGCIGAKPLDCYHPRVRREKDAMLAEKQGSLSR